MVGLVPKDSIHATAAGIAMGICTEEHFQGAMRFVKAACREEGAGCAARILRSRAKRGHQLHGLHGLP